MAALDPGQHEGQASHGLNSTPGLTLIKKQKVIEENKIESELNDGGASVAHPEAASVTGVAALHAICLRSCSRCFVIGTVCQ